MATPRQPVELGIFFDYPPGGDQSKVIQYWGAAGQKGVRMTPSCRKAFCATMEAAIERAVAVANCDWSLSGPSNYSSPAEWAAYLKGADYSINQAPYCLVPLGIWELSSGRDDIQNAFYGGCSKQQMEQLVASTCQLWNADEITLSVRNRHLELYLWQNEWFNPETYSQGEWVPDTETLEGGWQDFEIPWSRSMRWTPCDETFAETGTQVYAPWGRHTGVGMPDMNPPMEWLSAQLAYLNRQHIYVGSTDPQKSMHEMLPANTLGTIASGKLGNWMNYGELSGAQATSRRSSSEWSVLQQMLAEMQYTGLAFNYEATYRWQSKISAAIRVWSLDSDLNITCDDQPVISSWTDNFGDEYNTLHSSSWPDSTSIAATYDMKVAIPEDVISDYVFETRPMLGVYPIPNAKEFVVDVREEGEEGPGMSVAKFCADSTVDYIRLDVDVPGGYPAPYFRNYIYEQYPVSFVDMKEIAKDGSGMDNYYRWHRAVNRPPGWDLSAVVNDHASRLLNELSAPRSMPTIGPHVNMYDYDRDWWGQWEFEYPEQPNWPYNDPSPSAYAPQAVFTPYHFGRCQLSSYADPSLSAYVSDWGGVAFGDFESAFPGFPYGWDARQEHNLYTSGKALAQWRWRFKAMPAS